MMTTSQSVMSGLDRSPQVGRKLTHNRSGSTGSSRHSRQNSRHWEVMDDLQGEMALGADAGRDLAIPGLCEGYLMKKKKWPLQGWHKRYFVLDQGILKYSKSKQDIQKGRMLGHLDVSVAVMSINRKSKRIDLDAGDNLYHIMAKTQELFYIWVTKLSAHRVFKKNEAVHVHNGVLQALSGGASTLPTMASLAQRNQGMPFSSYPQYQSSASIWPSEAAHVKDELPAAAPGVNSKVSAWLQQTPDSDGCSQELLRCQGELAELHQLIQRLQFLETGQPMTNGDLEHRISMQNLTLEKPKRRSIWGHSRTLSRVEALGMLNSNNLSASPHLGASVQSIPDYVYSQLATPGIVSPEGKKVQQAVCYMSEKVYASLKSVHEALTQERERLRDAWATPDLRNCTSRQLANLCTQLSELEMQSRLTKVHSLSLSSDSTDDSFCTVNQDQSMLSTDGRDPRRSSVAESMAEYFDASDVVGLENSTETEVSDESGMSDITTSNSDPDEGQVASTHNYRASVSSSSDVPRLAPKDTGRRTTLPAHCPDNSHIGLMTILYNNIGKDLSRVSMPAAINEPVSLLQRVCEELEYPELLDTANHTDDPYERMVYIAAFSISGYAWAQYRSRYKPFNPVLGETFECIREDRGFRYVSEQVCHHPPISACHAESENFTFWQDQRWKNKFWGKSLEVISTGMVNVTLPRYGDHYEWNKVVTCIHNVLSQQRWLEHYGEVVIRNLNSSVCTCKMTFIKSRYWGSDGTRNEVQGQVLNEAGEVVHRFGGSWSEGIFCETLPVPQCIWKPNPQPENSYLYFNFSRMAMEMNELLPDLVPLLPPTDTRLRPDQRLLEEGKVNEADKKKDELEEKQRERRRAMEKRGEKHIPRFFTKTLDESGREVWVTNGTYWKIREQPGFANTENLDLWC
ncbi:oxysterol-binding protein-related protein 7-like isoform X2 [Anguilla rostrata]|uniref:oxysterol-binding protein-related protein 7-like isoform X2 n=1 Tax=Anguilla rostrata TaxID=7938 RepID=UPI0030D01ADC